MFLVSAEAKTSAGAPCWIWATRSEDPAKLKVTLTPGWAFSNSAPISVKVFFSDAAAKTVISPDSAARRTRSTTSRPPAATRRPWARPARGAGQQQAGQGRAEGHGGTACVMTLPGGLDDDGGGLDDRDGDRPELEPEVVDGLRAHQGHDPERAALHLDLGHHGVALMSVTRPTNRLRADRPTPDGSATVCACSRASTATW